MKVQLEGYIIESEIYGSSRSVLFKATRESDNKKVVIKVINNEQPSSQKIARFKHEYRLMKKLDISGVVRAYDLIAFNDNYAIILEYFSGESLSKCIIPNISINLFLDLAISIIKIIRTIHHEQIIHKDINPRNILWRKEDNEIRIIDFGISTELARESRDMNLQNMLDVLPPGIRRHYIWELHSFRLQLVTFAYFQILTQPAMGIYQLLVLAER